MKSKAWKGCFAGVALGKRALKRVVFALTLIATIIAVALPAVSVFANGQGNLTTITPNKLTIEWDGSDRAPVTIDTVRFLGYNVAQLRTMANALQGRILNLPDGTYQFAFAGAAPAYDDIRFVSVVQLNYLTNVTPIRDVNGRLFNPAAPGWVFLPDYEYNWGSVRDVISAMGLTMLSFIDNPRAGTTTVVVRDPNAIDEPVAPPPDDNRVVGPAVPPPGSAVWRPGAGWRYPGHPDIPDTPHGHLPPRDSIVGPVRWHGAYSYQVNVVARIPGAAFAIVRVFDRNNAPVTNVRVSHIVGGATNYARPDGVGTYRLFIPTNIATEDIVLGIRY